MLVKNVIKGHCSREEISNLVIINPNDDDIAIFCGNIENYLNPTEIMKEYKKEVDNMRVVKSAVNCGTQLFIIVE